MRIYSGYAPVYSGVSYTRHPLLGGTTSFKGVYVLPDERNLAPWEGIEKISGVEINSATKSFYLIEKIENDGDESAAILLPATCEFIGGEVIAESPGARLIKIPAGEYIEFPNQIQSILFNYGEGRLCPLTPDEYEEYKYLEKKKKGR